MDKLGYIRCVPAPEGSRKVFIQPTPAGQALRDVLVPIAMEMNEIAVRGLREADIAATGARCWRWSRIWPRTRSRRRRGSGRGW